ncbi:ABC transporter [Cinnamomum micranthum f. kanehirae]|uniref:ABC transporter n=1 Tax=Cinnamomum micranthum f. kanehirae TaxID=337451 RepID=A0A443PAH1_9MAGN|nr:ABC transporter [Cinnamomum micranthum f. kanehirae]
MQMEESKEEGMKAKVTHGPISFFKLLSYADTLDWVLMGLGTLGAIVHGMAQPIGYLLLGKALDAFGSNLQDRHAMVQALYKVVPFVWYMALATLPAGILGLIICNSWTTYYVNVIYIDWGRPSS